jgi:hypothetical protein
MSGIWKRVISRFLATLGSIAGYAVGRDLTSPWSGFWCVIFGFMLGSFSGLIFASNDELGMIAGAYLGAAVLFALWFRSNETFARIFGAICRLICVGVIAITVVAPLFTIDLDRASGVFCRIVPWNRSE